MQFPLAKITNCFSQSHLEIDRVSNALGSENFQSFRSRGSVTSLNYQLSTINFFLVATFTSNTAEETESFGRQFVGSVKPGDVIALTGDLGTGKTQFVKGF